MAWGSLTGRGGRAGAAILMAALVALAGGQVAAQEEPSAPAGEGELSAPLEEIAQGDTAPPEAVGGLEEAGPQDPEAEGPGSLIETKDGILVQAFADDLTGAQVGDMADAGGRVVHVDAANDIVTLSVAPEELEDVAAVDGVRFVQEVLEPLTSRNDQTAGASVVQPSCGAAHSEADTQLKAAALRTEWDVEGAGIEVGVLSDTWDRNLDDDTSLSQDIASGDIPGAANPCPGPGRKTAAAVLAEGPSSDTIDEGRAMAQLVHDLAPAAEISFATAFTGDTAFANNIRALRNAGADVIVDDVFYFNEPAYQNGPIGVAVEEVVAAGVPYFSAIGNETETLGGQNVSSYETPAFRPIACPPGIPAGGTCHDFNTGATEDSTFRLGVASGGLLRMNLKWNEPWNGVATNLDLYYVVNGTVAGSSTTINPTQSRQPWEHVAATATGGPVTVDVVVHRPSGSTTPRFKLEHVRSALTSSEYTVGTGGDVMGPISGGHSAAPNGVGVAAVPYNDPNVVESFSNHGPATWYWGPVSGSTPAAPLPEPLVLPKPDVAATDGALTTFFFGASHRFFGTSAAAPHAAAVAALLLDCNASLTPAAITQLLQDTAAPVSGGVPSNVGAGLVDAAAAGDEVCLEPPPAPTFSVSDASIVEGNGGFAVPSKKLVFTVSLSSPLPATSSVRYATANGTAVASGDYTALASTNLSFSAGQTSKTVSVSVKGDKTLEPDETMFLRLASPVGAAIADGEGVGTILNDEPIPVTPAVSVSDVSVTEGDPVWYSKTVTVSFTVRLSAAAPGTISVRYQTADGTAVQPADYTAKALTTLSFSSGQTSKTVNVTVRKDDLDEIDEAFFLLLSNPVGMTIGDGSAVATIVDDD